MEEEKEMRRRRKKKNCNSIDEEGKIEINDGYRGKKEKFLALLQRTISTTPC